MPTNYPEMWSNRVETNLTTATQAPWLDGVAELDTSIIEVGSGSASEQNLIHIPTTDFEVDVLINNSAYPLAVQAYSDSEVTLQLDKLQTKVVTLTDDQAMGASYARIDAATNGMTTGLLKTKYKKAIFTIAPAANTVNTPIIQASGRTGKFKADGTAIILKAGTRLCLTYLDLVDYKNLCDALEIPEEGRRLVLCTGHWNDLLKDRENFGDQLVNYKAGSVAPIIAGFQIYQYVANPSYNAAGTTKLAYGTVPTAGQYKASVFFYVPNIAKKTGLTKQYYRPSAQDPDTQTNRLAYRHYFLCAPKRAKNLGAITSVDAS
jgi:hypothetical protein